MFYELNFNPLLLHIFLGNHMTLWHCCVFKATQQAFPEHIKYKGSYGEYDNNKTLKWLRSSRKVKYINKKLPAKWRKYYKRWSSTGDKRRDYFVFGAGAVVGRGKEGIMKSFKDEEASVLGFEGWVRFWPTELVRKGYVGKSRSTSKGMIMEKGREHV